MVTALIHLDAKQKKRLQRRAELRGESFSQEVRDAVDLDLDLPVNDEEELQALARASNQSAGRTVKKLDETIAYVDRILKSMRATKTDRCDLPRFWIAVQVVPKRNSTPRANGHPVASLTARQI